MTAQSHEELNKFYKIKPVNWKRNQNDPNWWFADCDGCYQVDKSVENGWFYSYCWDDYYDEETIYCDSIEDAKFQAEQHYYNRILSYLIPVKHEGE